MSELEQLESGINRIRKDSQTRKMLISALEKEKRELLITFTRIAFH